MDEEEPPSRAQSDKQSLPQAMTVLCKNAFAKILPQILMETKEEGKVIHSDVQGFLIKTVPIKVA